MYCATAVNLFRIRYITSWGCEVRWYGKVWSSLGSAPVKVCCGRSDETSGPIKFWGISRVAAQLVHFRQGLGSMQLFVS
jgi:hypothetical protein